MEAAVVDAALPCSWCTWQPSWNAGPWMSPPTIAARLAPCRALQAVSLRRLRGARHARGGHRPEARGAAAGLPRAGRAPQHPAGGCMPCQWRAGCLANRAASVWFCSSVCTAGTPASGAAHRPGWYPQAATAWPTLPCPCCLPRCRSGWRTWVPPWPASCTARQRCCCRPMCGRRPRGPASGARSSACRWVGVRQRGACGAARAGRAEGSTLAHPAQPTDYELQLRAPATHPHTHPAVLPPSHPCHRSGSGCARWA